MPKLLFIWYKRSKGILEGGGQCSLRNFQILSSILGDENIDSYYIHDEFKKKRIGGYLRGAYWFLSHYFYGLTPKRVQEIIDISQQYDYVFIDRSVFGIIAKQLKESGFQGKIITHFHNVESIYFDALLPKRLPFRNLIIQTANNNDGWACKYSDSIIALNKRDTIILQEKYTYLPNIVQIPIALADKISHMTPTTELTRKQPTCLFLGSYFTPNNQGILWFIENVLPHVKIQMKIVGKGMKRLKEESPLLREIEVISDAPELLPYLQEADMVILPIFSGSGMKVKTCESLMYGKNIIGTPEAFEGYDVDYTKIGGRCSSPQEFIDIINNIINHPRPRFNQYARQCYLSNYSLTAIKQLFESLLQN